MNKLTAVKFNDSDRPDFFKTLKSRVNSYFKENNISRYANTKMKVKTIIILCIYFTPLALMLTGVVTTLWWSMLMWTIMGIGMSGIGLAIMHDANHGSYSKNQKVNDFFGFSLNFVGGYPLNWKIQHNVLHHTFTNIDDYDEDIEKKGILRFSPNQERKKFFKYQIFYVPILYGLLTFYWFIFKDYDQLLKYDKLGLVKAQGKTVGRAMIEIIIYKILYIGLFIVLPMLVLDVYWWQVILGFLWMQFLAGMILALIFQAAHVIEETEFFEVDETNKGDMENNWAIHQMKTTANFANESTWFSWFIGGLNFQVEHHLFPNICHVHYKEISKIVKKTAEEFDVPYHAHKTFFDAMKSHFTLLHQLGTGKYDELHPKKKTTPAA